MPKALQFFFCFFFLGGGGRVVFCPLLIKCICFYVGVLRVVNFSFMLASKGLIVSLCRKEK